MLSMVMLVGACLVKAIMDMPTVNLVAGTSTLVADYAGSVAAKTPAGFHTIFPQAHNAPVIIKHHSILL